MKGQTGRAERRSLLYRSFVSSTARRRRRRGALLRELIQGRMIMALRRAFPQDFELYRPRVSLAHPRRALGPESLYS